MRPIEYELERLRSLYLEMIDLVEEQINDAKQVLLKHDTELAANVMRKETRVNAYEINIDRQCEDVLALQAPLAADLRFTMAVLKMSSSLERIGDHAYRISSFVYENQLNPSKEIIELLHIETLFSEVSQMLQNVSLAFENEDPKIAKKVFKMDKVLDKANNHAPDVLDEYAKKHKISTEELIMLARVVAKLERAGDMATNIAEEIIFFIDSKVIKHRKKNKRIRKRFNELF